MSDDKDQTTRPKRENPEEPIKTPPGTARQPEYRKEKPPGAASGDPSE